MHEQQAVMTTKEDNVMVAVFRLGRRRNRRILYQLHL